MRIPAALVVVLVVGGLASGCGTKAHSESAPTVKDNAAVFDKIDLCTVATKSDLATALGEDVGPGPEASGAAAARDDDTLKDCTVNGVSQKFYLFLTLQRSPAGGRTQYDYDRSVATSPTDAPAAGGEAAFAAADDTEAHVEILDGKLVLRASFVYYYDGGTLTDKDGVVKRLSALTAKISKKL